MSSRPSTKRTRSVVQEDTLVFEKDLSTSEHKKKNELEDDVSGVWFGSAELKDTNSGRAYLPRYQVLETSPRTFQVRESRSRSPDAQALVDGEMFGTLRVCATTLNLTTTEGTKYSGSVGPTGISWRDGDQWQRKVVFFLAKGCFFFGGRRVRGKVHPKKKSPPPARTKKRAIGSRFAAFSKRGSPPTDVSSF